MKDEIDSYLLEGQILPDDLYVRLVLKAIHDVPLITTPVQEAKQKCDIIAAERALKQKAEDDFKKQMSLTRRKALEEAAQAEGNAKEAKTSARAGSVLKKGSIVGHAGGSASPKTPAKRQGEEGSSPEEKISKEGEISEQVEKIPGNSTSVDGDNEDDMEQDGDHNLMDVDDALPIEV